MYGCVCLSVSLCLCVSLFNQLKYYYCFFGYKDRFFSNTDTATEAKEMLMLELRRMSTGEADKQEDLGEPPVRKLHKVQASSSLDSLFDEIEGERNQHHRALHRWELPFSLRHILEKLLKRKTPYNTEGLTECDFQSWLKCQRDTWQPHAAVWTVKDCSAQCPTLLMRNTTGSQLKMQRSFFSLKRTCPSLTQNKFNPHGQKL